MNFLRKTLDNIKKPFGKGEKYERFAPAINAFDTFLFVPNHTTTKGAHVRDASVNISPQRDQENYSTLLKVFKRFTTLEDGKQFLIA